MSSSQKSVPAHDAAASSAVRGKEPSRGEKSRKKRSVRERALSLAAILSRWARRPQPVASMEEARKLTINVLTIAAALLAVLVVGNAIFERAYVIEAINVPKQLEERGYSGTVVAQRILDEIHEINRIARTTMPRSTFLQMSPEASPPRIEIPIGGISLTTLVSGMRQLFRITNTKITGEIVAAEALRSEQGPTTTFSIRVRVADSKAAKTVEPRENIENIDRLLRHAARQIVEQATPYIAASYYFGLHRAAETQEDRCDHLKNVERMIVASINTGDKEIVARAISLRGVTAHYGKHDLDQAIVQYKLVSPDTKAFPSSRYNLAEVYRIEATRKTGELSPEEKLLSPEEKFKRLDDARKTVDEGIRFDHVDRSLATGHYMAGAVLTDLARLSTGPKREEYYQEALRHLDSSIVYNSERAEAHAYRAIVRGSLVPPRTEAANSDYERANELAKNVSDYQQLACTYFNLGDVQQSVRMLERAQKLFPEANGVRNDLLRMQTAAETGPPSAPQACMARPACF